jgi:hypothetical protein
MPRTKASPQQRAARTAYAAIPRKRKTDDPSRYTKNPHEYGDVLIAGGKLGGALQRDLIYWIERNTWGDPKRPEFARLSLGALARMCQVWDDDKERLRPVERKSVAVALADLERRGIIEARSRNGCGPTTTKMYKLTPERWKAAPPYKPPTPREIEVAEAEAEAEEIADELETETAGDRFEQTVASGRVSKAQPLSVRPTRDAEPVTVRVVYQPKGFDFAVRFTTRTGANGLIQVGLSPAIEEKANDCSRAQPHRRNARAENAAFTEFETIVNGLALEYWGFALEDSLTRQIFASLAGAPATLFESIARQKLYADRRRHHRPALLVHLAVEACRSHTVETRLQARQRAASSTGGRSTPPAPTRAYTEEEREWIREHEEKQRGER